MMKLMIGLGQLNITLIEKYRNENKHLGNKLNDNITERFHPLDTDPLTDSGVFSRLPLQ